MKVAVVFVLLFATVLCRPARKVSDSSSESSEEVVRRPAPPALRKQALVAPQPRVADVQKVAAAAGSDESAESSDEDEAAAEEAPTEVSSDSTDTASTSDTASVSSKTSEDNDDDDDDDETEESETEEEEEDEESSNSSESGESSTVAPATIIPVIVTDEPLPETTAEPLEPTIVTDPARGDNLGGYPSDYKSIVYVEDKSYHKLPVPYKSYEFVGTGKKTAYDMTDGNEVEKSLKVYKALQVHSDLLEEDTSTPEVESQGLDTSSGTSQDISPRQAALPEEEESASTSESTTSESESSSTPEEEEEEEEESASTASDSNSTSQESEDEESQSSEEATATPGAADSDSDESDSAESDSDEEAAAGTDVTTDVPAVITAK
ncbi:osteopontin isoform X2 [Amphiprion ocellaris]|uniref:osteopontin isoform X2 n=1 Tax=Amphiprion ocellaris TaxID=80972 RepID=UPI000C3138E8|nr:osteopontin isoform X2 [Amphiprion ocellaris]